MIYYATRQTLQRYKIKTLDEIFAGEVTPEEARFLAQVRQESGNRLYEWGCKLFYFDGRKSMQLMHFETGIVIFLVDMKQKELEFVGNAAAHYLLDLYAADTAMVRALERYFASASFVWFDRLTNKSIIASMNHMQSGWALDGYRFYDYIRDGILHTKEINREVNKLAFPWKINGKKEWIVPYQLFEEKIKKAFGEPVWGAGKASIPALEHGKH